MERPKLQRCLRRFGVYFVRFATEHGVETQRMVRFK
jgi:hypothetical protein